MADPFLELLRTRDWLLADGAIGTNLFARGLAAGETPEIWNVDNPDAVLSLHREFVQAGSDIILTNSFGGTRHRLKLHGAEERVAVLSEAAARIARRAADEAERPVVVAGSMGPTGELMAPLGALDPVAAEHAFAEQARALAEGGADVIWVETLSAMDELHAAVAGAAATGLPVVCTLSFDSHGRTMMGARPADFASWCRSLEPAPRAFGTNCGVGAAEVVACVLNMAAAAAPETALVAKANCGVPELVDGQPCYRGTPELMAEYARLVYDAGARVIGGCCGTTPAHVRAMKEALDAHSRCGRPALDTVVERLGAVSAGARTLGGGRELPVPRRRRRGARAVDGGA